MAVTASARVIDVGREPALGENRLVEQADAGRDEAVERAGEAEHPERRRSQRGGKRRVRCRSTGDDPPMGRVQLVVPAVVLRVAADQEPRDAAPDRRAGAAPIAAHATRQPRASTSAPTSGNAIMNPMLITSA